MKILSRLRPGIVENKVFSTNYLAPFWTELSLQIF